MKNVERLDVMGLPVDAVTMPQALEAVDRMLKGNKYGNAIIAMNPRKVMTIRNDEEMKTFVRKAALIIPDGVGMVKAVRLLYAKKIGRVPGVDLMQNICKLASKNGHSIFVFGATEDVNKLAVDNLRKNNPGIRIAGRQNGFVDHKEISKLVHKINKSGADILFVALGSPTQEQFIKENLSKLNVKICQGIGGTLDVLSGNIQRSSLFMQRIGLEWLARQYRNPSRYPNLIYLFRFCVKLIKVKYFDQIGENRHDT